MIVKNDLGKISQSYADAHFLMSVQIAGETVRIPIVGYFLNPNPTLAKEGLLYTFSYDKNYAKFLNILSDFKEAAKKDGYEPSIWPERMLYIRYSAAALGAEDVQNQFEKYFLVYKNAYPTPLPKEDAEKVLDSVRQSRNLAENEGLNLYIWELNGAELWSWFKTAFLN
ncbi:MAG: hypothetical protein FJ023_04820 [Chloroflexi bacterium]|nr:hypothetical protein [Chloroflexota bacterium]